MGGYGSWRLTRWVLLGVFTAVILAWLFFAGGLDWTFTRRRKPGEPAGTAVVGRRR